MARRRFVHVCSACTAEFASGQAFSDHAMACPAAVSPTKGEGWDEYLKRSGEHAAAWRAANLPVAGGKK